jgi:hypothetical protein
VLLCPDVIDAVNAIWKAIVVDGSAGYDVVTDSDGIGELWQLNPLPFASPSLLAYLCAANPECGGVSSTGGYETTGVVQPLWTRRFTLVAVSFAGSNRLLLQRYRLLTRPCTSRKM